MKGGSQMSGFFFSVLASLGFVLVGSLSPRLWASQAQSTLYFAEQVQLSDRHLALRENPAQQSLPIISRLRIKYVDAFELILDGQMIYALSTSHKGFYPELPMKQAFVQLRAPESLSSQERSWAQLAREALELPEDIQIFFIEEAIDVHHLEQVSGVVEACTNTSTSRGHIFHQEAFCIGQHRVDELGDFVGETLTVLLKTQVQDSPYSCSHLTRLRFPRSCSLRVPEFIAEVRQEGLVIVRNYANEFKDGPDGQIFEHFPLRASAEDSE